jgi:hypothetical protein
MANAGPQVLGCAYACVSLQLVAWLRKHTSFYTRHQQCACLL